MPIYKQIIPATHWFYVDYIQEAITLYPVAAWAMLEDGYRAYFSSWLKLF